MISAEKSLKTVWYEQKRLKTAKIVLQPVFRCAAPKSLSKYTTPVQVGLNLWNIGEQISALRRKPNLINARLLVSTMRHKRQFKGSNFKPFLQNKSCLSGKKCIKVKIYWLLFFCYRRSLCLNYFSIQNIVNLTVNFALLQRQSNNFWWHASSPYEERCNEWDFIIKENQMRATREICLAASLHFFFFVWK